MSEVLQSTSLYLTEGSSDKEYHAQLKRVADSEDLWTVEFQYGRRGKALRPGTKTANPVSFIAAKKVYDDLVAEKMKGGYTPDVSGEIFQNAVVGEHFSGFLPQLPQTIRDESKIQNMLTDPNWVMQEKHDGQNRQIRVDDAGQVIGINKLGLMVSLPQTLADALAQEGKPTLVSGELIGSTLYVFDAQEIQGEDIRDLGYIQRDAKLKALCERLANSDADIVYVESARTAAEKQALCDEIRGASREGVVFKRTDAPFVQGKLSASAATQFKWKFTEDCTVRVRKVNATKRSVEMETDGPDGAVIPLGNVTIPSNHTIPQKGDLISVVYLHLFENGSLYQPQYQGVRTDCDGPDPLDQFKTKAQTAAPTKSAKAKPR